MSFKFVAESALLSEIAVVMVKMFYSPDEPYPQPCAIFLRRMPVDPATWLPTVGVVPAVTAPSSPHSGTFLHSDVNS